MTTPYLFDTGHDSNSHADVSDFATGGAGALAKPASLSIELAEEVLLLNGRMECRQAAEYLGRQPRAHWVQHFTRALEIGAFCLERATSSQDMEFVRRQADRLMNEVAAAVRTIPPAVNAELVALMGTQDGQVLAPIVQLVNSTSSMAERSVSDARRLLQEMDPARDDGTIGRALKAVRDLLDAERKDSVQARIESAVDGLGDRGGQFASVLRTLLEEELGPVLAELRLMTDRTLAQHAAAEVVNRTTEKGLPYELEVLSRVQAWGKAVGATVDHVGSDNRPGDIVVRFGSKSIVNRELTLVIEARDRTEGKGIKRVAEELEAAILQRNAACGLYVGRTQAAYAKEIGEWADGRCPSGPYVACIDGLLESALRYVVALVRLDDFRDAHRHIDAAAIQPHIAQVRTSMERIRSIKTKLTAVDSATGDVRRELDSLRSEVVAAVDTIQAILHQSPRSETDSQT
jgi:hypothetical protein